MSEKTQQKNIVYGNITAGGNVHIGDVIYNVEKDFQHSILFLHLEKTATENNYNAHFTLKSKHRPAGVSLLHEKIALTIDQKVFDRIAAYQEVRRLSDVVFRNNPHFTPETLRFEENYLTSLLLDTFFKGDILTVCRDFVELLEKRKIEELILAISTEDTTVLNLPFEMVIPRFFPEKLGETRQSLAVAHFGLVRTMENSLDGFAMQGKPASPAPLKMLFVTALPENLDENAKMLEIEEEQKRLIEAIGGLEATGKDPKIVIEFLDTAALSEIDEALRTRQHDILHISGHGSYDAAVKKGVLHLEDEDGNHREVSGKQLGETLRQHQCVKLLILSACETAIAGDGVVEQLAHFGVPSMVAMRFAVTDEGAKVFTTALYESLAKGWTLTHALAAGRESLLKHLHTLQEQYPNTQIPAEWFTPVVYLNQYTEKLMDNRATYVFPSDFYPHSDFLKSKNTRLIGSGFIGRKRYLNQLRRNFQQRKHVALHGLGGLGKTTLAEAFAQNFDNRGHEVIIFRNGHQIAEKPILDELFARLEEANTSKTVVRQIKQILESDKTNANEKLQVLIDNYLQPRKTILLFDNFEDVQDLEANTEERPIKSKALADFLQYLCKNAPKNCHLLFTTRYPIADLKTTIVHLELNKMTYAESYRLSNFSETLRAIPITDRQIIFKRLDGHPRAYEFLETLLQNDKTLTWTSLSASIGEVEAKVWENLLLEKIYHRLDAALQLTLQMSATCITRTPVAALQAISGENESVLLSQLQLLQNWSLCFFDAQNQTFEVHRLTREWLTQKIIPAEKLKQWAFSAGKFFKEQPTWDDDEIARQYFEIAEAWEDFASVSFSLQNHYQLIGLYPRAFELNEAVLAKNISDKANTQAYNGLGLILKLYGKLDEALRYLEQSLEIDKKIGDRKGEGTTLNNLATTAHAKGDYDTALRYLEQSLVIQQQIDDRQGEGTTLNNISQIYSSKGDYDTALHYLEQSFAIQQEVSDRQGKSTTLSNMGQIHLAKGNYKTAFGYLEQSLVIAQQINDRQGEGITLNNLAATAHAKGDYNTALRYLEKSLAIQQQIGDRQGEGTTLNNIGQIHSARGDYDTALRYLEQSLAIRQQIGDRQGEGGALNNISQIYKAKGDYDTALRYLKQSLAIQQQIGDRQGEGTTLNNLAGIAHAKGDYDTALRYWEQSLAIQQQISDIAGLAATLYNMGTIFFEQKNDIEKAVACFVQSYQIFQKIGSPNVQQPAKGLNIIIQRIGEERFLAILAKLGY